MDEQEEILQNNMISNLPLLFANGYPTSLEKISESQLERFIPFMVQCSLGHINLQCQVDCSEPEWWPEDLPFNLPLNKPKKFTGDWTQKLKELVLICYQFHKSVFLLRFCNDLSSYEHASLRFINNYNSTTSLFDRRSNKLLVTFRNENMSYDQPQRFRKCLLQQKSKSEPINLSTLQQMVESAPFDIYLCENCDAELYSKDAILEHEKTCIVEDDVILCDTPVLCDTQQVDDINLVDSQQRNGFLLNFNLQYKYHKNNMKSKNYDLFCMTSEDLQNGIQFIDKKKRVPKRNRSVHLASRCPTIPLSSPVGQLLLRTTKTVITSEYLNERLDRIERFCHAPLASKINLQSKILEKKNSNILPHCTFKRPLDYSTHLYVFPRRQYSQKRRIENILLINSNLLRRCRPISVRIKKICDSKLIASSRNKLNIKLTRDNSRSSNWKISSSLSKEIIVDTIDLCTSDEEDNQKKLCASNCSYITKRNSESDISKSNNNYFSKNSLGIHTSVLNIKKQLNFTSESSSINNSIENLQKNIGTYNSTSCLIKIEHKNKKSKGLDSINKCITADEDIGTRFSHTIRPSLYILSKCSTATPITKNKYLNRNNEDNSLSNKKSKSLSYNLANIATESWPLPKRNLNINSNIENESEEDGLKRSLAFTEDNRSDHNLPMLLQNNHIVSIDLTS